MKTPSVEETKLSGQEIINKVKNDLETLNVKSIENVVKTAYVAIDQRRKWQKNRQNQIDELERLMISLVKDYDDDNVDNDTIASYKKKIDDLISKTSF